jgi:hypothetical protein
MGEEMKLGKQCVRAERIFCAGPLAESAPSEDTRGGCELNYTAATV